MATHPTVLAAVLVLTVAGCRATADEAHDRAVRDRSAAAVMRSIRVVDGDTVQLGAEVVRISNIDAPEMPRHARCWAEARLALSAKERLEELIANSTHDPIALQRDTARPKDRYGRTLGHLVVGRVDLGQILIDEGLAVPWIGHRWDWCSTPDGGDAGHRLTEDQDARGGEIDVRGWSVGDLATRARLTGQVRAR